MNKSPVVTCTCIHPFQDKEYGPFRRATTPNNKRQKEGELVVRCTVCTKEHHLGLCK